MYSAIQTRPHVRVTEQVMELIGNSTCWHFDAWMMRAPDGTLFLRVQTRAGGRDRLTEADYVYLGGRLQYAAVFASDLQPITMQDRAEWPRFAEFNELHWRHIVPMSQRVPAGYRSRSVALHYVRAPSLEPFDADVVNMSHAA